MNRTVFFFKHGIKSNTVCPKMQAVFVSKTLTLQMENSKQCSMSAMGHGIQQGYCLSEEAPPKSAGVEWRLL